MSGSARKTVLNIAVCMLFCPAVLALQCTLTGVSASPSCTILVTTPMAMRQQQSAGLLCSR
jgi:hypothetical protein